MGVDMLTLATMVFKVGDLELFRSTGTHIPAKDEEVWVELPQGPGLYVVDKPARHTFKHSPAFSNLTAMHAGDPFDIDPGPVYVQLRAVPLA
jgi:hypothetical protein